MAKIKTKTRTKANVKQITRSAEVREQILGIQEQKEKGYVNLALLLYEAYRGEYAKEWGYLDFKTYAENELATRYRKAMNFVEIGEVATNLGLPKSRLEAIGWSKLRILAPLLTKENMEEWLSQAEEITYRELDEVARKERVDRGELDDRPKVVKLTIKMSEAEAGVIESAIDDAKKLTNSDNMTVALEMICSDWMEVKGATPGRANLDDHIAYLEKVYGCKLNVQEEEEAIADDLVEEADAVEDTEEPTTGIRNRNEKLKRKDVGDREESTQEVGEKEVAKEKVKKPKKSRGKKTKKEVLGKTESAGMVDEQSFVPEKEMAEEDKKLPEETALENTEGSSTGDAELDDLLGL